MGKIENRVFLIYGYQGGMVGGINWEAETDISTKQITNKDLLHSTGALLVLKTPQWPTWEKNVKEWIDAYV